MTCVLCDLPQHAPCPTSACRTYPSYSTYPVCPTYPVRPTCPTCPYAPCSEPYTPPPYGHPQAVNSHRPHSRFDCRPSPRCAGPGQTVRQVHLTCSLHDILPYAIVSTNIVSTKMPVHALWSTTVQSEIAIHADSCVW